MAGVEDAHIFPGARVLYLGAASGTSVSHVSDIVGPVKKEISEEIFLNVNSSGRNRLCRGIFT